MSHKLGITEVDTVPVTIKLAFVLNDTGKTTLIPVLLCWHGGQITGEEGNERPQLDTRKSPSQYADPYY